jgi:hypothetical protein
MPLRGPTNPAAGHDWGSKLPTRPFRVATGRDPRGTCRGSASRPSGPSQTTSRPPTRQNNAPVTPTGPAGECIVDAEQQLAQGRPTRPVRLLASPQAEFTRHPAAPVWTDRPNNGGAGADGLPSMWPSSGILVSHSAWLDNEGQPVRALDDAASWRQAVDFADSWMMRHRQRSIDSGGLVGDVTVIERGSPGSRRAW